MFCIQCGSKLPDGAVFCPNCGTKVMKVTAEPSDQPAVVKPAEPPITFSVCGEEVIFDGSFRQYTSDRKQFLEICISHVDELSQIVEQNFRKSIERGKDDCLDVLSDFGGTAIDWMLDQGISLLIEHHVYSISKDMIGLSEHMCAH